MLATKNSYPEVSKELGRTVAMLKNDILVLEQEMRQTLFEKEYLAKKFDAPKFQKADHKYVLTSFGKEVFPAIELKYFELMKSRK
jgi:hypothetical protein